MINETIGLRGRDATVGDIMPADLLEFFDLLPADTKLTELDEFILNTGLSETLILAIEVGSQALAIEVGSRASAIEVGSQACQRP